MLFLFRSFMLLFCSSFAFALTVNLSHVRIKSGKEAVHPHTTDRKRGNDRMVHAD